MVFGRLARELRRKKVTDFESIAEMRNYVVESIQEFRRERQSGVVASFHKESFDTQVGFAKIGGGSLGGKARGLAFVREMLYNYRIRTRFRAGRGRDRKTFRTAAFATIPDGGKFVRFDGGPWRAGFDRRGRSSPIE